MSKNAKMGKGEKFSKQNFRKEMREDNGRKFQKTEQPKKDYKTPIVNKKQWTTTPTEVFEGILTKPTLQEKGYSVLSKGQQVRVEIFEKDLSNCAYCRVVANDGRVGITMSPVLNDDYVKRMSFAV